jgi:hypothetical protein
VILSFGLVVSHVVVKSVNDDGTHCVPTVAVGVVVSVGVLVGVLVGV